MFVGQDQAKMDEQLSILSLQKEEERKKFLVTLNSGEALFSCSPILPVSFL